MIGLYFAMCATAAVSPDSATAAEKELFAQRFDRAAELYRSILKSDPNWAPGYYGLVRALIGAYRPAEAYTAAEEGLAHAPEGAETLTAAGLAAYRRGDLPKAAGYFQKALKINPNEAGALAGLARIDDRLTKFKTAAILYAAAYKAKPEDPEFMEAKARTLHDAERIGMWERALTIYDPGSRAARSLLSRVEAEKARGGRKVRRLTSTYQPYTLKLFQVASGPRNARGVGMKVVLNGKQTVQLVLDTGASGIAISPKAALKAGLEDLGGEKGEIRGLGNDKPQLSSGYLAKALSIGDLIFADYPVEAFRSASDSDVDGLIGADVFAQFIVEIDFERLRLTLEPFPEGQRVEGHEPEDAADELSEGFFRVIRIGNHLTVWTSVNQQPPRLFLIDSGSSSNLIDTANAKESTKVRKDSFTHVRGIQGKVADVARADEAVLQFAGYRMRNPNLISMSLDSMSDAMGMAISGVIGMPVLWQLKMTVDYRNGAVRFEHNQ